MEVPHSLRTDKSFRTRCQVRCHGHIDEVEVAGSSIAAASLMTIQVMAPKCLCARNKYSEVLDIHLAVICVLTVCRHRVMLRFSSLIVSSVVVMACRMGRGFVLRLWAPGSATCALSARGCRDCASHLSRIVMWYDST
jgi:hypothetical protein